MGSKVVYFEKGKWTKFNRMGIIVLKISHLGM